MFAFGYLLMVILSLLAMALLHRQMKRRDAGLLDARGKMLLQAETAWLFSYGAAFVMSSVLCFLTGNMALDRL